MRDGFFARASVRIGRRLPAAGRDQRDVVVLLGAAVYGGSLLAMGIRPRDFARQGVE